MRINLSTILTILLLFMGLNSYSQAFGGNPPSLKWKQLETNKVKVIFPPDRQPDAQRVADIITAINRDSVGRLGDKNDKISIVLQSLSLISNAYVGLAPWRSEFYMTPLQNSMILGSGSWVDMLTAHEYRHVHQYSNFRTGISKFAYLLFGQEGQGVANALAIPDWFFEGDAVYAETKYLSQGRGRLPNFFDDYHALWTAEKKYSYQKLRNGSFKDLVPDHYQLGYLLIGHGNNNYGNDFWKNVTHDAAGFRGILYPFQTAVKRYAGVNYRQFVKQTFSEFKAQMPLNENINNEVAFTKQNTRLVVHYLYPNWLNRDTVLVLKKAYNQIPHWVLLSKNFSKNIGLKFIGLDDYFNFKKDKIIYTGYSNDVRWGYKEFNDVYIFNIRDGSTTKITKNQRLFSPDVSPDEQSMVAIQMPQRGGSVLQFWDLQTRKVTDSIIHPEKIDLSFPVFGRTNDEVFLIAKKSDGSSSILNYSKISRSFKELIPFVNAPMAFLKYRNQQLIFTVTQSRKNEIWMFDLFLNKLKKLSSAHTGSYGGDVHEQQLIYSRPTAEGEQLFKRDIGNINFSTDYLHALTPVNQVNYAHANLLSKPIDSLYQISDYASTAGLLNIHSWRPNYERPNWSVSFYSLNVLNNFETSFQYLYNQNEGAHQLGATATYGAWFPWIIGGADYAFNRNYSKNNRVLRWNEWNGKLGLFVPLNKNSGRFYKALNVFGTFNYLLYQYDAKSIPTTKNHYIPYLHFQLTSSLLSQQAIKQINPRLGWTFKMHYKTSAGNLEARQTFIQSRIFLPGLFKTHALNITTAFQQRDTLRQYVYPNNFALARGYSSLDEPNMWRMSVNYHFPIIYPDFGIANIVYFKRIRGVVFYDDMYLKNLGTSKGMQLRSTGLEIHFDTNFFNLQPFSIGIRYSRLLDSKKLNNPFVNQWEFIIPLNLLTD